MANKKFDLAKAVAENQQSEIVNTTDVASTLKDMGVKMPKKKVEESRTCVIMRKDQMQKVKLIGLKNGMSIKDVFIAAVDEYISKYEKENGGLGI